MKAYQVYSGDNNLVKTFFSRDKAIALLEEIKSTTPLYGDELCYSEDKLIGDDKEYIEYYAHGWEITTICSLREIEIE